MQRHETWQPNTHPQRKKPTWPPIANPAPTALQLLPNQPPFPLGSALGVHRKKRRAHKSACQTLSASPCPTCNRQSPPFSEIRASRGAFLGLWLVVFHLEAPAQNNGKSTHYAMPNAVPTPSQRLLSSSRASSTLPIAKLCKPHGAQLVAHQAANEW